MSAHNVHSHEYCQISVVRRVVKLRKLRLDHFYGSLLARTFLLRVARILDPLLLPPTPTHSHTIRVPHIQQQLHPSILNHIQNPPPRLIQRFTPPWHRLHFMISKQRRHGRHKFDLCEFLARTASGALRPCEICTFFGVQELLIGKLGANVFDVRRGVWGIFDPAPWAPG